MAAAAVLSAASRSTGEVGDSKQHAIKRKKDKERCAASIERLKAELLQQQERHRAVIATCMVSVHSVLHGLNLCFFRIHQKPWLNTLAFSSQLLLEGLALGFAMLEGTVKTQFQTARRAGQYYWYQTIEWRVSAKS